ncbi:MAG: DUF456 domain-containing protein [Phycisphaerales bacterium]
MWAEVQFVSAAVIVIVASILGVGLTLITLPGTWAMLLVALVCKAWQPDLLSWWVLGIAAALALLAEAVEFFASAAGSRKAGGSRSGAVGSILGALGGAIAGTILLAFLPIIGTVIGAVAGAGLGASLAERGVAQRTWGESYRSGRGAAIGRAWSIVIKGAIAGVMAFMFCVDALWN